MMLLVGRFPTYGYYALMFSTVLKNILKVTPCPIYFEYLRNVASPVLLGPGFPVFLIDYEHRHENDLWLVETESRTSYKSYSNFPLKYSSRMMEIFNRVKGANADRSIFH